MDDMLTIGKDPISEECPQGTDTRYEETFEELQTEIDKLGSPSATDSINWQRAGQLAGKILVEESKDLLVGSYFAVAQIYISRIDGFETGLLVYRDLLQTYWNTMFPKKKRMRGRVAAVEWWIEKSAAALKSFAPAPIDEEHKNKLLSVCEDVKTLCNDFFPDPPDFGLLTRAVADLPMHDEAATAPVAEPVQNSAVKSEETASTSLETQTANQQSPAPSPKPVSAPPLQPPPTRPPAAADDNAAGKIQAANENIKRAALVLTAQEPANSLGHRALRTAVWASVDSLPQATDNRTIIPPPEPHIMTAMQDLSGRGDWLNLLTAATSHFPQYILWLDLQRYCAVGLENLGLPYAKACEAVCMETAYFLKRIPGILQLQFADGFPFADEETRDWCQELGGGDSINLSTDEMLVQTDSENAGKLDSALEQAGELVKKRKLIEAVQLLQEGMAATHSARESMQWRLGLVRTLINGKKPDIALSHCEKLADEIERYRMESWDPAQALVVYKTTYLCLKMISSKMMKKYGSDLLDKIARLDSAEAIRLMA